MSVVVKVFTLMTPTIAISADLDARFLLGLSLRLVQDLFHSNLS